MALWHYGIMHVCMKYQYQCLMFVYDIYVYVIIIIIIMITREIREASSPTMHGHFGCIFKATEEYTTRVWCAFYMRIMDT
jgi:hypothetical protein